MFNTLGSQKQLFNICIWYFCVIIINAGAGRGKDMANITGHRGKDISTILQAEEGKENGRPPRPNATQRRKKRRRLNDLDSDSTVDEEESEEEFRLSERYVSTHRSRPQRRGFPSPLNSSCLVSARRKSLSCPTTRRSRKRRRSQTAATAAGGATRRRGAGGCRNAGRAPGRGGDPSGTQTMKRRRRMMKWRRTTLVGRLF